METGKSGKEHTFSKHDGDGVALTRAQQRRIQRYNFTLGVVCGLVTSCVVIFLLFAFQPKSLSKIQTTIVNAENQIESEVEALVKKASPKLYKALFRDDETSGPSCKAKETDRFDCWPHHYMASESLCQARNCCWDPNPSTKGVPYCFYPDDYVSYTVTSVTNTVSPPGMKAMLERKAASPYPDDVVQLQVDVAYETESTLRFKIFDPNKQRYEVPLTLNKESLASRPTDYNVTLQNNPFGILVTRKSNGAVLFDSRNMAPLVFADQFLQLSTRLASPNIYGLGEHRHALNLGANWTRLVLWTRDQPPSKGGNLYGAHPFYLNLEEDGQAHGVFLLNSNAIEAVLQPYGNGQGALTYHVLGGVLDIYIFTGPSPLAVIEQYVSLIGKPAMPPFWALGFHLSRFGYMNSSELRRVIESNRAAGIPYDVQWNDIDYMRHYLDWTYDNDTFSGLRDIVDDLHQHDQRYVLIVDPGVSVEQAPGTYPPFDQGKEVDIFIKNASGDILVGQVSPGMAAYPDFFHPKVEDYWFNQMQIYYKKIPFDGLWTDMNEPGNFVDGSVMGCTDGPLDNPPFTPPFINGGKLAVRTVCPSAQQAISTHYNLHNMYGWSEAKATATGLKKLLGKRSFVLSRSTFPSSGRFGAHWLGDNRSEWPDLYYSIPGILNFNMFGIPMVGADVCGFGGNTTRELCIRWMQLGAFYPFMRNHACINTELQDPASFDSDAIYYMKSALETRYCLLPYIYTRFYLSHLTGTPVVRPLFALFEKTENIDRQFMWGDELLITPVLVEGATQVGAYFPRGVWYDFHKGTKLYIPKGLHAELQAPIWTINVHVRGGSIIPILPPAKTTNAARKQPFNLLVAPDENSTASGSLFWDDGESLDSIETNKYTYVTFTLKGTILTSSVQMGNYPAGVANFLVLGLDSRPRNVSLNGRSIAFDYDAGTKILKIRTLGVDVRKSFTLYWT